MTKKKNRRTIKKTKKRDTIKGRTKRNNRQWRKGKKKEEKIWYIIIYVSRKRAQQTSKQEFLLRDRRAQKKKNKNKNQTQENGKGDRKKTKTKNRLTHLSRRRAVAAAAWVCVWVDDGWQANSTYVQKNRELRTLLADTYIYLFSYDIIRV